MDVYLDSRTVFNIIAKDGTTLEKRLQIDAHALRESYARGELRSIAWIPGTENVADGLTKGLIGSSHPLWKLIVSNKLCVAPLGWVGGPERNFRKKTPECGFCVLFVQIGERPKKETMTYDVKKRRRERSCKNLLLLSETIVISL